MESFHIPYKCRYCESVVKGRKELSDHLRKSHYIKCTLRDYFNQKEPPPAAPPRSIGRPLQKKTKRKRKSTQIPIPETDFKNSILTPIKFDPKPKLLLKAMPFPLMNINEDSNDVKEKYFDRAFKKIINEKPVLVLPVNSKLSYWESYAQFD